MLSVLAIGALLLFAALLGIGASRPDTFRVERVRNIPASPERIFSMINDFSSWAAWSPYEKLDPAMKKTFSGAACGKGAVYSWTGNTKAGEGRMEITDVSAPSKVTIKLEFVRPFQCENVAEFTLRRKGESTDVTWALYGPQPYLAKVMTMFFNRDKLVGKDFEKGLANLQVVVENTKQRSAVCN